MGLALVTAPAEEPVSLEEAKLHLRQDLDADDTDIAEKMQGVREHAESWTRRAFVTQTWDLFLDGGFPAVDVLHPYAELWIPKPPLQSITHVKYVDTAGVEQTLVKDTDYVVDTSGERGRVYPVWGGTWPVARRQPKAVQLRFVCGYGGAGFVPSRVKEGIKAWLEDLYDMARGTFVAGATSEPPFTAKHLLASLRSLEPAGALEGAQ